MKHIFILHFPLLCLITLSSAYAATSVPFTVTVSEPVNVAGCPANCPRITLDVGGVTRYADYSSGSGTANLTFTYTTQAGDLDLDGIAISSNAIDLNTSGTVKDLNGNNLSPLTFTIPNTSAVKVNHPSLLMDFIASDYILNGTHYANLPSFLTAASGTFTRASVGTYFDSAGTMQTAASGTPRFDYAPVTHVAKGIFIEEARTNYLLQSSNLSSASWGASNTTKTTGVASIDGGTSAVKIVETAANGFHTLTQSNVQLDNTIVTMSIFAKAAERTSFILEGKKNDGVTYPLAIFDLSAGTIPSASASLISSSITPVGNGWYRCAITFNTGVGGGTGIFFIVSYNGSSSSYTGTAGSGFYAWGPQLEQGYFPTSFISTTTAAVTRQSDVLTMPTGGWYSATRGTLSTQSILPYLGGNQYPGTASIDDGTGNNAIHLFINDAGSDSENSEIFTGAVNHFSSGGAVYIAGSILRQGVYYNTNAARMSMDGVLGTLDSSVSIPTVSILHVGARRAGSNPLNGWIQNVKYYPLPASDTQLQLLTQ